MGMERKRKVSLLDVVDKSKIAKINGGGFSSSAASGSIIGGGLGSIAGRGGHTRKDTMRFW